MKKIVVVLMTMIFALGLAGASFAVEKTAKASSDTAQAQVIKGKIVSIDSVNNQVTIKDAKGVEKTVSFSASDIASLKKDQEVKVTLKPGSNMASSVKVVKHKAHTTK